MLAYVIPFCLALLGLAAFALAYVVTVVLLRDVDMRHALMRISLSSAFTIAFLGLAAWETHRSPLLRSLRSVRLVRWLWTQITSTSTSRYVTSAPRNTSKWKV